MGSPGTAMKLILTLMRNDDPKGSPIDTRSFDDCGLTLGRGGENDWVLDDPNRHLSKSHCAIEFEGGEFVVTDISTNGVFINQSPERLGRGNTMGLRDGDLIGLGEYLVRVEIAADGASVDAAEPLGDDFGDGFEAAPSQGGFDASGDPFDADADLPGHAQAPGDDPFAEFDPPASTGGGDGPLDSFDSSGGDASASAEMIPEDFDIFADDAPDAGLDVDAEADHVPSESEFFRPPAALPDQSLGGGGIPDDWDADLGGPLPQETVSPALRPAPARAAPQPVAPPPPAPARSSPPPVAPVAAPAPSAATADALTAFLSGAGLDGSDIPTADAEAMKHTVGAAFREMVKGLQETLFARSEIKSEFRLERTMIRPQENNPLKFSPSVDEAMLALLKKGGGGGSYLPPVAAVHEGFNDLKAHQVAVMAGMQVALAALLRRFDPATLEKRLKSQSVLESILPAARKAKYWELYDDLYKEIAREAEDDFQGLFGREFATAYERQVKKL